MVLYAASTTERCLFIQCKHHMVGLMFIEREAQEISVFDAAYNHSFDMEYFYFLYGLPGGNAWSVDSKKIDEIRTNFYTMIKAYPKLKDYMTPEMYKYHPLMFANKIFPPRLEVCVNRSGKVFAQLQEAQSFNEDPLNKAKGLKYQFQYEGTLNRRLAYKLYDTLIRKDEDVSQYVYEYSLKGAKKIMQIDGNSCV